MVERIARSSSTVSVACKLPNGLILQLYKMEDSYEQVFGGGTRKVKTAIKVGEPVTLSGCALPQGVTPQVPYPGGYSLTTVPRDFWEAWLEQNADSDFVKNRIVFSEDTAEKTSARAREQTKERTGDVPKGVRSGLERLDPKDLPKVGLGMKIKTYDAADRAE